MVGNFLSGFQSKHFPVHPTLFLYVFSQNSLPISQWTVVRTLGPHVKTYEDINAESHLHWCIWRSYFPFSYVKIGWLNVILQLTSIPTECLSSGIFSCKTPVYHKRCCDWSYILSTWPEFCSIRFTVTSVTLEGLSSSWLQSAASQSYQYVNCRFHCVANILYWDQWRKYHRRLGLTLISVTFLGVPPW